MLIERIELEALLLSVVNMRPKETLDDVEVEIELTYLRSENSRLQIIIERLRSENHTLQVKANVFEETLVEKFQEFESEKKNNPYETNKNFYKPTNVTLNQSQLEIADNESKPIANQAVKQIFPSAPVKEEEPKTNKTTVKFDPNFSWPIFRKPSQFS